MINDWYDCDTTVAQKLTDDHLVVLCASIPLDRGCKLMSELIKRFEKLSGVDREHVKQLLE